MARSGYRLGRRLKSSQKDRRDYITYLQELKSAVGGAIPPDDIPAYALVDDAGNVLVNMDDAVIVADPTPRTI